MTTNPTLHSSTVNRPSRRWWLTLAIASLVITSQADDRFKADNQDNLNLTTSWDGGVAPGANDVAVWDNRVTAATTLLLGADLSWGGIRIEDPLGAVQINAGNTLTLGAAGIDTSAAVQPLTLGNALTIAAPQTWNITTLVTVNSTITGAAGNGITKSGFGTLALTGGINAFGDWLTIDSGIVNINNGTTTLPIRLNGGQFTVGAALSTPIAVTEVGGNIQITANRTLSGAFTGTGIATILIGGASTTLSFSGPDIMGGFNGTLNLGNSPGGLRPNAASFAGSSGMTVDLGVNNGYWTRNNSAATVNIGALQGAAGTQWRGGGAGTTYAIGGKNLDTVFSGAIIETCAINKVGSGTLTLDGPNTHTGTTMISAGVLQIGNGSDTGRLGNGAVINNAALVFNRDGSATVTNAISGFGNVTNLGPGRVILTGANSYIGLTVVAAGELAVGSASQVSSGHSVGNGATLGAVLTSANATVTKGNITFGFGCSYHFDLGTFGNPFSPVASSLGTVTLNDSVVVNLSGTNLAVGSITLLEYVSRAGAGSFVLGSLPGNVAATLNDDTANKRVTLTITSVDVAPDATLRWVGDATGNWDIDNPANAVWQAVSSSQITHYTDGVPVLFDDTATGTTTIQLLSGLSPAAVTVNNTSKTYAFEGFGGLFGEMGLTKQGSGVLNIANQNFYTGVTVIEAGVIRLHGDAGNTGGGNITNNGALVIDKTEVSFQPYTHQASGQIAGTGSVSFLGIDTNNSIFQVMVGTADGNPYSGGTTISNALVRMDPVNTGNTALRAAAKSTGLGSGTITFLGDSVLRLDQAGPGDNGSATAGNLAAPLNVPAGQSGHVLAPGRYTLSSPLTGGGNFSLTVGNVRGNVSGNWSAFAGQINILAYDASDDFRVVNVAGWPTAKLHLGPGVNMYSRTTANAIIPIGELSGEEGSQMDADISGGTENGNPVTWLVGGLNTDATFAGNIVNGLDAVSLIKQGAGKLTLSGTNTSYTGSTTVSNGVLALVANVEGDAGLSNSATITLAAPGVLDVSGRTDGTLHLGAGEANQTLRGAGTIRGNLVVGNLGALSPGFSVGTLTVTNQVSLGGNAVFELDRSLSPNSDRLVAPTIAAGGTLTVTNLGPALQVNDTFQLFSTSVAGAFATVNLPATDPVHNVAYTWENRLAVDGTVRVLTVDSSVNPNPSDIALSVNGGVLELQWPADRTGWTLQTNAVSVADAGAWFEFPAGTGSRDTNQVFITIDPGATHVFYRLVYP